MVVENTRHVMPLMALRMTLSLVGGGLGGCATFANVRAWVDVMVSRVMAFSDHMPLLSTHT